jgi:2-methylisocitrate lyase-like PEP mutase family enzyme
MANPLNLKLKQRLAQRDGMLVPGAPNALAARIIADLGFEAIYVTGAGVTNMHLGLPDIGLITLSEIADHVGAIRDVVDLPLVVDADTGFGNPVNVGRTITVLERAGANAIQLEDQVFPKKCGHFAGKDVVETDEMVQKIHAAVDARRDDNLLIVARTDARALYGMDAALERAQAYIEAGADVTFVEAPRTVEELALIPQRLAVPQIVNLVAGGLTPLLGRDELQRMGFAFVLYANAALRAAIHGMQDVLRHLQTHGSLDDTMGRVATFAERQRLVGKPHYDALEKKYVIKKTL